MSSGEEGNVGCTGGRQSSSDGCGVHARIVYTTATLVTVIEHLFQRWWPLRFVRLRISVVR